MLPKPDRATFVALFGGVLGFAQDLETILNAAGRLKDKGIRFVFAGDGPKRREAVMMAEARGLCSGPSQTCSLRDTVKFLPFVSPEAYEELARTADCGLVALKPGITSIPSKIAWFLGRGLPVVAVLPGGAAAELVLRSGGGMRVEAGADAHLAFCIEWLATHPEQRWRMGELGRAYAGRELSRGKAIDQWDALLRGLT